MRFQPGSTVIMLNTIRTYPNRVISTYDTQKAIDLLEAHGVTDYAVIERKERLVLQEYTALGLDRATPAPSISRPAF